MPENSLPKTPVEQDADRRSDRERLGAVERRLEEVVGMLLRLNEGVQDLTAQARNTPPLKRRLGSGRNARAPLPGNRRGSVPGAPPELGAATNVAARATAAGA